MRSYKYFIFLLIITVAACSNTEQTVDEVFEDFSEDYLDKTLPAGLTLENVRTQLSDSYVSRSTEIPEGFRRIQTQQEEVRDPYEGYRIQIYSGQNVDQADTVASRFRAWSDTTIVGYQPKTYVFFKTPYYRVHVGDFHSNERANKFSNLVKRAFSDAWVVHDQVEPASVPADTADIKIKEREKEEDN